MALAMPSWNLALTRFGCGAKPGDGDRRGDPREALLAELAVPDIARLDDPELRPSQDVLAELFVEEKQRAVERRAELAAPEAPPMAPAAPGPTMAAKPEPRLQQRVYRAEALARVRRAVGVELGFVERWVAFWSNHFCVSAAKGDIDRAAAGGFEREVIRANALGRFADMLRAVEQHPAMLFFLDNAQSLGPNSLMGHGRGQGLNENLAREILELHTMGVGAGYTQADVTQLAYILTGWSIAGRYGRRGDPGAFAFDGRAHEPLAAVVRGRTYLQPGVEQGEAALDDVAREPATAEHIAQKLARHFVADDPPPALVHRLAENFAFGDGDLAVLARTLIQSDEAWSAPRSKMRNPWEITVAAYRAFAREPSDVAPVLGGLAELGMPLWSPAGPNGFSDDSAAWLSPEGLKMRVELAARFVRGANNAPRPQELVDRILGPETSADTREAIGRAESVEQAYALLLLAPEFQRR